MLFHVQSTFPPPRFRARLGKALHVLDRHRRFCRLPVYCRVVDILVRLSASYVSRSHTSFKVPFLF